MNIHLPRLAEEQAQGLKTMKVSFSSTPVLPQVQATPQVGCPPRGASSHQCRAQRESYTNKQHVSASTKYRASLLLTFYEPKRVTGHTYPPGNREIQAQRVAHQREELDGAGQEQCQSHDRCASLCNFLFSQCSFDMCPC